MKTCKVHRFVFIILWSNATIPKFTFSPCLLVYPWAEASVMPCRVDVPFVATLSISVKFLNRSFTLNHLQKSNISQYHLKGIRNVITQKLIAYVCD